MKPTQADIEKIKSEFAKMQTKDDLLQLMNEAKKMVYEDEKDPFTLRMLTYYSHPNLGGKRYKEFKIKKKSGGERAIHAPARGLKAFQKVLSFILQCVYEPHSAAMGFVWNKSIVDNAKLHEGSLYVYNLDLKDFFPSIDQARFWKCLQLKPFNLVSAKEETKTLIINEVNKEIIPSSSDGKKPLRKLQLSTKEELNDFLKEFKKGFAEKLQAIGGIPSSKLFVKNNKEENRLKLANMIAAICCTELKVERKNEAGEWVKVKRNVLPQGAPTSPVITNIVCQKLDFLLSGVAKRFGLKYSRYADDITFSSMHNVFQAESEFIIELHRIIASQNFHIKESKTRLQKEGHRKEVTGLLVNEKANVQKRYIKQLRMWLYYWERYGYERAYQYFLKQYITEKGHVVKGKPNMAFVIAGKLDYLKMVKGGDNELYLKLWGRFEKLNFKEESNKNKNENLVKTLSEILGANNLITDKNKINELMEDYYSKELEESHISDVDNTFNLEENNQILTEESANSNNLENNLASKDLSTTGLHEKNLIPKYLNPSHLYNFLFHYNQNEILRTTCHDIDSDDLESILEFCKTENYNFKEHLKMIHVTYSNHERMHNAPFQVKALIRVYLTGKDYYGNISDGWSNNIKINWNCEELSNWVNLNIGTPPNLNEKIAGTKEIELLEFSQIKNAITAIPVQNFTQLVLHFKNLFHIKSGAQSLKEILKRVNSERSWNEKVDLEFDEHLFFNNLEHFTYVEKLIQSYIKIIELINNQHKLTDKPKINLKYFQQNQKVIFSIHHLNSVYNKTIENTIERLGQTYTSLIKKQINGLCNLYLKADFGNQQFAEINLWNGKDRRSKSLPNFQGVEHIMEFPKLEKL